MKKATQKTAAPVNLGNKRACIKCGTKFYDFNKEEITCPKCNKTMKPEDFALSVPLKAEPKRPKASEKVAPEALVQSDDSGPASGDAPEIFESADELADGEADLVEDLDVDEDENDF